MMSKVIPLIVILGGTGTGKSKLAIEIAKKLSSEIISADSMQVYKGLDILTNKVTIEERAEVPHHLLDFVSPLNNFTVVNFRDMSVPIIDRLFKSGKPPVIVGGTNYYIESLLWQTLVDVNQTSEKDFFGENDRDSLILNVYKKLVYNPPSKAMKRKSNEAFAEQIIKYHKLLSVPNKLALLTSYCNKILIKIKDKLSDIDLKNKLIDHFDFLMYTEPNDYCEERFKLIEEILNNYQLNSSDNFNLNDLKSCILLKKNISFTSSILTENFNDIINDSNLSTEKIFEKVENKQLDAILSLIQDDCQLVIKLLESFIPSCVNNFKQQIELHIDLNNIPSRQLHKLLKRVDSNRAASLHPNDGRKILRSLEIWCSTGRTHSDFIQGQQIEGSALGGPLRYKNTIIFWLTADTEVLNKRLDDRVHQMLDNGLVKELLDFYSEYKPKENDFTKGIFQSIGFKEFREFLFLSDEDKFGNVGKKKLDDGIETLKLVTRRYVKYQNKWIRNRFFKYPDRDTPPVYNLDTTNIEQWNEAVFNPAMDVIISTMEGKTSKLKPLTKENDTTKDEIISMKTGEYFCEVCQRTFIGLLQWNSHINSNKHKKVLSKVKQEQGNSACMDTQVQGIEKIGNSYKKLKTDDLPTGASVSSSLLKIE